MSQEHISLITITSLFAKAEIKEVMYKVCIENRHSILKL